MPYFIVKHWESWHECGIDLERMFVEAEDADAAVEVAIEDLAKMHPRGREGAKELIFSVSQITEPVYATIVRIPVALHVLTCLGAKDEADLKVGAAARQDNLDLPLLHLECDLGQMVDTLKHRYGGVGVVGVSELGKATIAPLYRNGKPLLYQEIAELSDPVELEWLVHNQKEVIE